MQLWSDYPQMKNKALICFAAPRLAVQHRLPLIKISYFSERERPRLNPQRAS